MIYHGSRNTVHTIYIFSILRLLFFTAVVVKLDHWYWHLYLRLSRLHRHVTPRPQLFVFWPYRGFRLHFFDIFRLIHIRIFHRIDRAFFLMSNRCQWPAVFNNLWALYLNFAPRLRKTCGDTRLRVELDQGGTAWNRVALGAGHPGVLGLLHRGQIDHAILISASVTIFGLINWAGL